MGAFRAWIGSNRLFAGVLAGVVAVVAVVGITVAVIGGGGSGSKSASPSSESPSTTAKPRGTFGVSEGANVEIAPGLVALSFTAPEGGRGRVTLDGPSRIVLEGEYVFTDDSNWTIAIDDSTGSVAGVALQQGESSGTIVNKASNISSDVNVGVSAQPEVVPAWEQSTTVRVSYGNGENPKQSLVGDVTLSSSRGANSLSGSSRLGEDDTYSLPLAGSIRFAGTSVPLSGDYRGVAVNAAEIGSDHSWSVSGNGGSGSLRESKVRDIRINMNQSNPGVTGSTTVNVGGVFPMNVWTGLWFVDSGNWTLNANGSDLAEFTTPNLGTLISDTSAIRGAINAKNGIEIWDLRAPMQVSEEKITATGDLVIGGPFRFDLETTDASGNVLGSDVPASIGFVTGVISFDNGEISGSVRLLASGEALIDMPDGWQSAADLRVHFDRPAGGPLSNLKEVSYLLTNGDSRIVLSGSFNSSSAFELVVGGSAAVANTSVPFGGYFQSVGWVVNGQPLTEARFSMIGDIASVPGGVNVGAGSSITAGQFGFSQGGGLAPTAAEASNAGDAEGFSAASLSAPTTSGTFYFTLSTNNPWTLKTTVDYKDQNNWTATVVTSAGDPWTVSAPWVAPGVATLSIDPNKFSGSITDADAEVEWEVRVDEITWQNSSTGSSLVTDFSVSNSCPLEENCPEAEGIFLGFTNGSVTFPSPIPHMSTDGAFLTDGSWARFDAFPDDVTFNNISMHDTAFTMWKGERDDSFNEDLEMPDLSAQNSGFNIEFCGYFTVSIPSITTVSSGGCVDWTQAGLVMAQIAPGGDVDSDASSGGVTIGNTTIDGWAWSDLAISPEVIMNGVELALDQNLNEMTGTMAIPANLMKATGNANADASITCTGWYSSGDFSLDSTIDVNMKSGGVTLDSVSVHIGKDGSHFSLELGANATVSMGGNHFPVTALIALGVGGGSNEITVSVSAKGSVNNDPTGGFDTASSLPTGTFEPDYSSIIDGSFDAKQAKPVNDDPGFEKSTGPTNLYSNPDFESGVSTDVFYNSDFESGNTGNVFPNGDGENTELLVNGDFETGSTSSWITYSGFGSSIVGGTAPSNDQGYSYVNVWNQNANSSPSSQGLVQSVPIPSTVGATYRVSAWVKSNDSSNGRAILFFAQQGTAAGCPTQTSNADSAQSFTVTPTWQQISMDVTGVTCKSQLTLYLNVPDVGDTVQFDAVSVTIKNTSSAINMPITSTPLMYDEMNSTNGLQISTSGNSTVSIFGDFGNPGNSIRTYGTTATWMYPQNSWGYANGDFNMSFDVFFPNSGSRDAINFGFWLKGNVGSQTGYGLRLQSATGNNNDSGIHTISNGVEVQHYGNNYGAMARNVWYRVNLSTSGSTVSTDITKLADGSTWASWSVALPNGNRDGVFGENKPCISAVENHRIDNVTIKSSSAVSQASTSVGPRYIVDPSNAHSGLGYLAINAQSSSWNATWSTGEVPVLNDSYSLTAWVRSRSGTITGTIGLDAASGTYEYSNAVFTATSSWSKVTVTVPMVQSGHTDVRWYLRDLSNSGAQLDIDDVVLQSQGKWTSNGTSSNSAIEYAQYTAGPNSDVAHGGIGSMVLTDRANGTWFTLKGIPPRQGATYTASLWMKSESGTASGSLQLSTIDGYGNQTQSATPSFSVSTSWQQFTVAMTVNNSGMSSIRLQFQLGGNKSIRVDDIVTTITGADVPQEVDQAWGPQSTYTDFSNLGSLPITKTSGVTSATDFGNGGASLSTNGYGNSWMFNSGTWGYTTSDFEMSTDVYFPNSSTWDIANVGFWMTGSVTSQTGYAFRLNTNQTENYGFIKVTNGATAWTDQSVNWGSVNNDTWYRVKLRSAGSVVTVEVIDLGNGTTIGTQSVTMPSGNRSGALGQVKDGAGASTGSRWDNFQVFRGSSVTANQKVILDASKAHGGSAALQIAAPSGSTATATRTVGPTPAAGSSYTATAWVRSSAGSVNGSITLAGQSSGSTSFTATTNWQQVSVTTAMGSGAASGLTTTFTNSTSNSTLIVDDVSVQMQGYSQQNPWIPAPDTGGAISQAVWNDATKAHSGTNYMEVQPKFTASNFYKETAVTLNPYDVYTASFWVKTKNGNSQGASFALMQGMWGSNYRWVDFTATGTWQKFFVTLPISSASPGQLAMNFYLPNGSQPFLIDDIEIEKMTSWGVAQPSGTTVNEMVNQDGGAASGAGFLQISANGANTGIYASQAATSSNGTGYSIEAYVRSSTGANVNGTLKLYASGANGSSDVATQPFTANGDWQYVTVDLTSNGSYTSLTSEVRLTSGGKLDVDEIKVMPKIVVQDDPWVKNVGAGGSVSATIYADATNAHDSLGVLRVSKTGSSDSGIQHTIDTAPAAGSKYVLTAWVRSVTSATMDGQWTLYAQGGTQEYVSQGFQANQNWQMVTLTLPVNNSGHTSMLAQMVMRTAGVEMWVDDVYVQSATWLTGAANGTTMQSKQMNDASKAQSGSGYQSISKSGSPDGWLTRTASGLVNNGTSQTVEAYVRSADGTSVSGRLRVTGSGGSGTDVATTSFTATKDWKKVSVTVPITQNGRNALQTQIFVDTQNKWLDIDSVVIGQAPLGSVDGVATPLAHPETGYTYLWDDAFGVPGAHLWGITAQIQFVNGRPGLGVGATMYFDPTKLSSVMTGTDWIKGDMALNISRAEPCLMFDFDASSGNSGIHIDGGVFTTKEFNIAMAPKGCQVGDYVVPAGASLGFDAQLGDGEIYLNLELTKDDDGLPEFHADMGVSNIKIGGFMFNAMELKVDITTTSSSTHFLGDFQLPMGNFYADYNLDVNANKLHMDGQVSVTNWTMKSADFSVESFNYRQVMDVPFGAGQCGSFDVSASGNLTMKSKRYSFNGRLAMDCGRLNVLHFDYQYSKSGVFYTFNIDYNSDTKILAGGLEFNFDKKMSWKFFGIRRTRHPQFNIQLQFSMPINNPSAGSLYLYGAISVSGGNGRVSCTFGSSGDDGCDLHVHVNVFGGQTLDAKW